MREQTIHNQISHILNAFPEEEMTSRSSVTDSEIPGNIRHFLLCTLDRRLELEAIQSLPTQSAWFDVEDERVHAAFQQMILAMSQSARFPSAEFPRVVRQAVEIVLNYLISPVETLVEFIFPSGSDSVTVNDVRRKSGYFSDYPYLGKGVDAFLERTSDLRIFKSDFERTVSHLDRQFARDYSTEDWLRLLQPLVKMVDLASPGLPVAFVYQFFTSKGRDDISSAVTSAAKFRSAQLITVGTLEVILRSVVQPGEVEVSENAPIEREPEVQQEPEPVVPLWKKFQEKEHESEDKIEAESSEVPDSTASTEPLWKQFQPSNEGADIKTDKYKDPAVVVLGVGINQKERFVRDLFQGDEDGFNATMKELGTAPDWTTASEVIADLVFRTYQVDIYSESAVDFTNAVESRYSGHRA